ncbi:MAG: hypothetical protein ABIP07_08940 [Sphingomicrobium sp.]
MITLRRFQRLLRAVEQAGYDDDTVWSEQLGPPTDAKQFAEAAVYVIVNSGMKYEVAQGIYMRCLRALHAGNPVRKAFGHPGKAKAIDQIWAHREELFEAFLFSNDQLEFCASLPWVGPVTKYHLAKDFGIDVAKPDVHLARLAIRDRTTVARMCARLSRQSGFRIATIDTILWRACATGILNSRAYEVEGWRKAFRGRPSYED